MNTRTNFRMEDFKNITMVRGDTLSFGIVIKDDEGHPLDIESAYFSCKKNLEDEEFLFQKSLGAGITKIDDGKYSVRIAPSDTSGAEVGKYFYDCQIGKNGDVFTILRGIFVIEWEVTE